jgi:hypothetical protein
VEIALLGAGAGPVELLLADERLPLALPVDGSYAFDGGLARRGWVAVHVGYQVAALQDGRLLRAARLPDAWRIRPAADPALLVVDRYFDRSRDKGEDSVYELVDARGAVLEHVSTPARGAEGQLRDGRLVTDDGLLSWDGSLEPLPFAGRPRAVLDGRLVLYEDDTAIHLLDLETGARSRCERPELSALLGPVYDQDARAVAFDQHRGTRVLVATAEGGVRWLDAGFEQNCCAWLDGRRLLLVGDRGRCVLDVRSGESSPVSLPRNAWPHIGVTGRFDPAPLRAALRPPWSGPLTPELHAELLAASAARLDGDQGTKAIRLRSCIAPKRIPVGASHFGGRPDLPRGHRWPRHGGEPLPFLVQLRLDELAAAAPERDLPRDGLLCVFAGGSSFAVHAEVVTGELKRAAWPAGLEERYDPSLAVAEPVLATARTTAPPDHRAFGIASTIQEPGTPEGHELLLQIDGDALTGMEFGDGGRLHIWAPAGARLKGVIAGCLLDLDGF